MPHQALNKDNDNIFIQFDRTNELIIELISALLDRNNKSINIANIINNNINDEINNYQFTFDIPTEIEIQQDMEKILKNKKTTNTTSSLHSTLKEIKQTTILIKHLYKWAKMNLMQWMSLLIKKNKKIIRDIIDAMPGLSIDDKLNPN